MRKKQKVFWRRCCSGALAAVLSAELFLTGTPVSAAATEESLPELTLWYDEPAVADFYEVYAKKYKWLKGKGDGFLEFGRNDPPNYEDGRSHGSDSSYSETGRVTQAVYDHVSWAKHALPVGNGHMGAMTFGHLDVERIQMNEDTLWTGGPNHIHAASDGNADAYGNVNVTDPAALMQKLVDNAFTEYYKSMESGIMPDDSKVSPYKNGLTPKSKEQEGSYQSFCDVFLDFGTDPAQVTNYRRGLDLNTATSFVTYEQGDTTFRRELFASYPDDVMVYRVTGSKPGSVSFTLKPEIPHVEPLTGSYFSTHEDGAEYYGKEGTVTAAGNQILLSGTLNHNGMQFAGSFQVLTTGGTVTANNKETLPAAEPYSNGSLTISNADEAIVLVSLDTDYMADFDQNYVSGETMEDLKGRVSRITEAAAEKGWTALREAHLADYQELFHRVTLSLGGTTPSIPTDELLDAYKADYKKGTAEGYDHYLETLYFQYGRYLLIESSREGSLPANLQGVWNDMDAAPWSSDYHTNINVQMNYWPAGVTNLAETLRPLVDFANDLRKPGRLSLAKLYGIGWKGADATVDLETEDGFLFFCNTTPLGFTGNIPSNASFTATATAFLAQNLYDYHAFTQDVDYLREHVYPYLREASLTYLQTLQAGRSEADADKLYVVPSWSSEQTGSPWTVGTYFDQQLVWQLFHDTIQAMSDLGITPAALTDDLPADAYLTDDGVLMAKLSDALNRLDPVALGTDGQIKEWQQESAYNQTKKGTKIGDGAHRHISQLVALYPGNYVTKDKTELVDGAKIVLENRTDNSTGWGLAHRLNLWARTGDGDHSYRLVNALLATATYDNLFDTHAPFQIDGNLGGTAGIAEMLLQSQSDVVELLPALPKAWKDGSYTGLVARGNFQVDCTWEDGTATETQILSRAGGDLTLTGIDLKSATDQNGKPVSWETVEEGVYRFSTSAGQTLRLSTEAGSGDDGSGDDGSGGNGSGDDGSGDDGSGDVFQGLYGDVDQDGRVTLSDASLLLRGALGITELSDVQRQAGDYDQDGSVTLKDVTLVLKRALGILS